MERKAEKISKIIMTPFDPKLFDLILKKYKDRFLILTFRDGYGGHLVSRIIKSSNQYYCNEKDPLRFPDSIEGFPVHLRVSLDFKTQHLAAAHQDDSVIWPWRKETDGPGTARENYLNYLNILKNTDYHLNVMTHDFSLEEKYTEIKRIRIFGKFPRPSGWYLNKNREPSYKEVKPSNNKLVYNLNINKLLSEDYDEFEDEYRRLTWTFYLNYKVNSVRSFILLWREKQKRLVKYS